MLISFRFSSAFNAVENLSHDLQEKNIALTKMDELKDKFLALTTHELRTPLHGIIGLSESMIVGAAGNLPSEARENLSLISSSGQRLAVLVNDILDMAQMKYNEINLNTGRVDIRSVADAVIKLCTPLLGSKPVIIENRIPGSLPSALADEDRLKQILHNLIANAIKFTDRGRIDILAHATTNPSPMIKIMVHDTGRGIPEKDIETIFDMFHTTSDQHPGSGLGLQITRELVELQNGSISVQSEVGEGTVFSFTLPVARDSNIKKNTNPYSNHVIKQDEEAAGKNLITGNPAILIVDDDPVNLRVLGNFLSMHKCSIITATNGLMALDKIKSTSSIDLVLLDIMMPVISGYDVCRKIRKIYLPDELPVIMLTAKNMVSDINEAYECGANDYIVKPFRIRELIARINNLMKMKTASVLKKNRKKSL